MQQHIEHDLLRALENDSTLDFKKRNGTYLTEGICPGCGKRDLYVFKDKPFIVKCNRQNNCGYSESTRDRYRDLFENLTDRVKPTQQNPHATADAYLRDRRGFDIELLAGCYSQAHMPMPDGSTAQTVRFCMPGTHDFWERVIDERCVRVLKNHGKDKARIVFSYKDQHWQPPAQTYTDNDTVYIVEGIFHCIAWWQCKHKAVASFSTSNLPRQLIEQNKGRGITWRLAFDGDKAGTKAALKYFHELKKLGEKVEVVKPLPQQDWDDLYRAHKITPAFIDECLYRGRMLTAANIDEAFYHRYCKRKSASTVLEFNNRYYACSVDSEQLSKKLNDTGCKLEDDAGYQAFCSAATTIPISNCTANFLYCEIDKLTQEISYFFRIDFCSKSPTMQMRVSGNAIESASSFNKALLQNTTGGSFRGLSKDFNIISERWFKSGAMRVHSIPFIGYDRDTQAYVFQDFAYHNGRELRINENRYFTIGDNRIKTTLGGFSLHKGTSFKSDWLLDFHQVFSDNGIVALAFFMGSLFADQIRQAQQSFPFLELSGDPGAGKSLLIEFLWKLVGRSDYEGFDPSKSTFAARARSFNQVSNLPVVLIESDRSEKDSKKGAFDFSELKTAYNGRSIRSVGVKNNGNEVMDPPFRGTIIIAQNARVDAEEAVLQRIVHCHFNTDHFSAEGKHLSNTIFAQATVDDFAGFMPFVLAHEKQILERYFLRFTHYENKFTERAQKTSEVTTPRIVKNHAQIMAMVDCLQLMFPALNDQLLHKLMLFVWSRAKSRQAALQDDHPLVSSFWDAYEYLNVQGTSNDDDAPKQVLNHSMNAQLIAINLKHFDQVCREKRMETIATTELNKLLHRSQRHKFIDRKTVKSGIFCTPIKCWVFTKTVHKGEDNE